MKVDKKEQTEQEVVEKAKATTTKKEKVLTLEEKIAEWKKEYGKIYESIIAGKSYIYRRITRKEYGQVMAITDGETMEDRIDNRQVAMTKAMVLNVSTEDLEKDFEELQGLAETISDLVLEKSGFGATYTAEL
jgi:hypothetical protein